MRRASRQLGGGAWTATSWVLKHTTEIKGALWIAGVLGAALLAWYGIRHWQIEFGDYRLKIERREKPIPLNPWKVEVKEEPIKTPAKKQ